jgi:hypothetical protein
MEVVARGDLDSDWLRRDTVGDDIYSCHGDAGSVGTGACPDGTDEGSVCGVHLGSGEGGGSGDIKSRKASGLSRDFSHIGYDSGGCYRSTSDVNCP